MIEVEQTYGAQLSGTRNPNEREKRFKITGTDNEDAAYAALSAFVYSNFPRIGRLIVKSVSLDEGVPGASVWEGTATYGKRDQKEYRGEMPEISFSTKGGTARITRSRRTVVAVARPVPVYQYRWTHPQQPGTEWQDEQVFAGQYDTQAELEKAEQGYTKDYRIKTETITNPDGTQSTRNVTKPGKPINFHHGIEYESGTFKGVDIVVPALNCTISVTVPDEKMNPYYNRLVFNMTGTVNGKPFLGFKAGEWLFMGCDMKSRFIEDEEDVDEPPVDPDGIPPGKIVWDLSFEFRGSPNVTKMYIAGLGPFAKRGHDYAWAYCEKRESTSDDVSNPNPEEPEVAPDEPPVTFSDEKMTVTAPLCIYSEEVYPYTDFSALGLQL